MVQNSDVSDTNKCSEEEYVVGAWLRKFLLSNFNHNGKIFKLNKLCFCIEEVLDLNQCQEGAVVYRATDSDLSLRVIFTPNSLINANDSQDSVPICCGQSLLESTILLEECRLTHLTIPGTRYGDFAFEVYRFAYERNKSTQETIGNVSNHSSQHTWCSEDPLLQDALKFVFDKRDQGTLSVHAITDSLDSLLEDLSWNQTMRYTLYIPPEIEAANGLDNPSLFSCGKKLPSQDQSKSKQRNNNSSSTVSGNKSDENLNDTSLDDKHNKNPNSAILDSESDENLNSTSLESGHNEKSNSKDYENQNDIGLDSMPVHDKKTPECNENENDLENDVVFLEEVFESNALDGQRNLDRHPQETKTDDTRLDSKVLNKSPSKQKSPSKLKSPSKRGSPSKLKSPSKSGSPSNLKSPIKEKLLVKVKSPIKLKPPKSNMTPCRQLLDLTGSYPVLNKLPFVSLKRLLPSEISNLVDEGTTSEIKVRKSPIKWIPKSSRKSPSNRKSPNQPQSHRKQKSPQNNFTLKPASQDMSSTSTKTTTTNTKTSENASVYDSVLMTVLTESQISLPLSDSMQVSTSQGEVSEPVVGLSSTKKSKSKGVNCTPEREAQNTRKNTGIRKDTYIDAFSQWLSNPGNVSSIATFDSPEKNNSEGDLNSQEKHNREGRLITDSPLSNIANSPAPKVVLQRLPMFLESGAVSSFTLATETHSESRPTSPDLEVVYESEGINTSKSDKNKNLQKNNTPNLSAVSKRTPSKLTSKTSGVKIGPRSRKTVKSSRTAPSLTIPEMTRVLNQSVQSRQIGCPSVLSRTLRKNGSPSTGNIKDSTQNTGQLVADDVNYKTGEQFYAAVLQKDTRSRKRRTPGEFGNAKKLQTNQPLPQDKTDPISAKALANVQANETVILNNPIKPSPVFEEALLLRILERFKSICNS